MGTFLRIFRKQVVGAVLLALLLASIALPSFVPAAAAAGYCECVGFVKNVLGITQPTGNAKDMGAYLSRNGFRTSAPQVGAVAVMQPRAAGADATFGHVGIISSVQSSGNNWQITLEGARQGGREYEKANCTNVSLWTFSYPKDGAGITYYVRNTSTGPARTEVLIDDRSGDFVRTQGRTWFEYNAGYNGHIFWTWASPSAVDDIAEWRANLAGGRYEVYVHIPNAKADANARYQVFHQGGTATVTVNQAPYSNQWVSLGQFNFSGGAATRVRLNDVTGQGYPRMVAWDAVKFVPR